MGEPIVSMVRAIQVGLAVMLGTLIVLVLVAGRQVGGLSGEAGKTTALNLEVPALDELPVNHAEPTIVTRAAEMPRPSTTRNVGGGLIAAPVEVNGPLERIEPVAQPTPPPKPQPIVPFKPKSFSRWKLVFNSVIPAAGVFDLNGSTMVLPDIDIIPANETCIAPNGLEWPCGMAARTAFRNFVKGRAVTCQVPDLPPQQAYVADCRLQGQDMAAWLVEHGWARAKPSTPLVQREDAAKQSGRGVHGNPPPGIQVVKTAARPGLTP